MNAVDMIAQCMRLSESSQAVDIVPPPNTASDTAWLAEKCSERAIPEEPMGSADAGNSAPSCHDSGESLPGAGNE